MTEYEWIQLGWKVIRVKQFVYGEDVDTPSRDGIIALAKEAGGEEQVNQLLEKAWTEKVAPRSHAQCKDYFMKYGSISGRLNTDDEFWTSRCVVCNEKMLCGDQVKPHNWKELSVQEARQEGVAHFGMCYHVVKCVDCGEVTAYDSSG